MIDIMDRRTRCEKRRIPTKRAVAGAATPLTNELHTDPYFGSPFKVRIVALAE
jgi:hypothetical protein